MDSAKDLNPGVTGAAPPGFLGPHAPILVVLALQTAWLVGIRVFVPDPAGVGLERFLGGAARLAEVSAIFLPLVMCFALSFRTPTGLVGYGRVAALRALLFRFLLVLAIVFASQMLFVAAKINIPRVLPFVWDDTFAAMDRALLGTDAWKLTHSWIGPGGTRVLDMVYVLWFPVVYTTALAAGLLPIAHPLRIGYLTAFGLVWFLGGTIAATGFSSAGPIFVERVNGDTSFAPLLALLEGAGDARPLFSLGGADFLWLGHLGESTGFGISAFPSIHCALVALAARLGFAAHPLIGIALTFFAAAVFVGSVHLAWHYAVDGIAGFALAAVCWVVGMALGRRAAQWRTA